MTGHEMLQTVTVVGLVWHASRYGTWRAYGGVLIALVYAMVSGMAWNLEGAATLVVLALAHITGSAVCLLFSVTMGGIIAGWIFIALMGLDVLTFAGVVQFDRPQGVFWAGAYADWKGVLSYALIIALWMGISGRNRFQPFLAFRGPGGRDHGNHGWPLAVENDPKTTRSGGG